MDNNNPNMLTNSYEGTSEDNTSKDGLQKDRSIHIMYIYR